MNIIPIQFLFLHIIITGVHEIISKFYYIGERIIKPNRLILAFVLFPILVKIFTVKDPHSIAAISINTPIVDMMAVQKYSTPRTS